MAVLQSQLLQRPLLHVLQPVLVFHCYAHCVLPMMRYKPVCGVSQVQVHVEANPDRVMAATVASSAQTTDQESAFAPIHGYTTDTLLKDKRFKAKSCPV